MTLVYENFPVGNLCMKNHRKLKLNNDNIDKFAVKDHQNLQQLHRIKTTQHMILQQAKTDKHDYGKTAATYCTRAYLFSPDEGLC